MRKSTELENHIINTDDVHISNTKKYKYQRALCKQGNEMLSRDSLRDK